MTTSPPQVEPTSLFHPAIRRTTVAILTVVAMSAFEGLAVAAALPELTADLGEVRLTPWVITSYLLTSGVATVAAGALVDQHGVRRMFRISVIVFLVGSALSGLAPSMELLIVARALQGIGAGAVNAVGLTAVGLAFPKRLVARAFAANSNVWGLMGVAGPAIAALLLTFASWRWIFLVNLPIGALALYFGWNAMPGPTAEARKTRVPLIDLLGLTAFTLLLLYASDALDWTSGPAFLGAMAIGAALLASASRRQHALLSPRHALYAPLGPLAWAICLLLVGSIGVQSFVPLLLTAGHGVTVAMAAWSVLFFVLGWTSGANASSRLADRVGMLRVYRWGGSIPPFALAAITALAWAQVSVGWMFPFLYAAGLGMGLSTNSGLALLRSMASDGELGRAVAAHQFLRNLGFAIGNGLVGGVILAVVAAQVGDVELVREVIGGGGDTDVQGGVSEAIRIGFATAATVATVIALIAQVPLRRVTSAYLDSTG